MSCVALRLAVLLSALLSFSGAAAAQPGKAPGSTSCPKTTVYTAAARNSAERLLEARYGLPEPYGVDRLSFFDLVNVSGDLMTASGETHVDPGRVDWQIFKGAGVRSAKRLPGYVLVAFDRCSGLAIGVEEVGR
jgi:hypothetical protein